MLWILLAVLAVAVTATGLALATAFRVTERETERETDGNATFGKPLSERRAARRSRLVIPIARILAALRPPKASPTITHKGVRGPSMTCPLERFAAAENFEAGSGDVFVATQMKCGTTWMQQVVNNLLDWFCGVFEMATPSLLDPAEGSFFESGEKTRGKDMEEADRQRILVFCRERLQASAYPAARFYPDLANDR